MKLITRTIWVLSLVSMFADVASEMLYPVIPIYLQQIGFSVIWIGFLEGFAGFTAGLSKGYFGKWSDGSGKRLPFIKAGYFLSAMSKPMMAVFTWPLWIFSARTLDRLGKGIRTAARDALLSDESSRETKARVFGFHRAWDTFGAMLGPIIALGLLYFMEVDYKTIFYLAFIPGLISVALIFLLKEKHRSLASGPYSNSPGNFFSYFSYWKIATPEYRRLIIGLLIFVLFNSSDIFLLLRTREITGSDTSTIIAYIIYNLVYALASFPMGILADRFGSRTIFICGIFLFAIVYAGFAFANSSWMIYVLFIIYGLYAAATEGIAKAWITNLASNNKTATAVGFYTSCESVAAFIASVVAGLIWASFGPGTTFGLTALAAGVVLVYFLRSQKTEARSQKP